MLFDYIWSTPGQYDSETQTYFCPHCSKIVAGKIHKLIKCECSIPHCITSMENIFCIVECPSCHCPTIYDFRTESTSPIGKALRSVENVPDSINTIYEEIRTGISAGCYTSSVILARTILMYIAIEKGAENNSNFLYYINYLTEHGYTPPDARSWIDKIRIMGNQAVHQLEVWKKEDAELIGKFVMYLLIVIYELPLSLKA